jgi:hypothetical protein
MEGPRNFVRSFSYKRYGTCQRPGSHEAGKPEGGLSSGWPLCVYGLANRIRPRIRSCRKVSELFRYRNSHERCETERTIRCFIGGDDGLVRLDQTETGPGPSHLPPWDSGSPSSPANIHLFAWLVSQSQHDSARHFAIVRENRPCARAFRSRCQLCRGGEW